MASAAKFIGKFINFNSHAHRLTQTSNQLSKREKKQQRIRPINSNDRNNLKPEKMADSQQSTAPAAATAADKRPSVALNIEYLFLAGNALLSAYFARGDPWKLGFVVFVYGMLTAVMLCLHLLQRREAAGKTTGWLRVVIWVLTTVLSAGLLWWVARAMPPGNASAVVWVVLVAFCVVLGGLYGLMLYRSSPATRSSPAESPAGGEGKDEEKGFVTKSKAEKISAEGAFGAARV